MPLQFTTAPGHWHDAKPAVPGWARLARIGLQHGKPAAKDTAGGDRRYADYDGLVLLEDSTGIKMLGEGEWKTKSMTRITIAKGARCNRD